MGTTMGPNINFVKIPIMRWVVKKISIRKKDLLTDSLKLLKALSEKISETSLGI